MRKKLFNLFVISLCAVCVLLTGCSDKHSNIYDATNTDIRLTDLQFDYYEYEDPASLLLDPVEKFKRDAWIGYGIDIDECLLNPYNSRELEICSERLTEFFIEVYGVDISKKIKNVETYSSYFTNDINGFSIPGTNIIILNQYLIDSDESDIKYTWCHEVIHALGLNYPHQTYEGLYETITEAVTFQFFEWNGNKEFDNTLYRNTAKTIGYQLINADPSLVSCSIADESFLVEEHINEVLRDATYPFEVPSSESDIAYQLSSFLYGIYQETIDYQYYPNFYLFTAQEITTAYCREFNLDKETITDHKEHWLIKDFDKLDIVYDGYCYTVK